jgi:hypothetical protein
MPPSTGLPQRPSTSDPNMLSWSQYLHDSDDENSSESEDDFRGDSLNDADWDGQGRGTIQIYIMLITDFTKQYNRQKTIIQNTEAGVPPQQGPKRNPQANVPSSVPPAAYTSRKAGEYDDSLDSLTRYAGRIKLKDDDSKYLPSHLI